MRTSKYSAKMRNLYDAARRLKQDRYVCPKCGKKNVKRVGNALWKCRSCEAKIAGGAYSLSTGVGVTANRVIRESMQQ
ncbi:MAG: 50S ribosomal protein L37ae [Candidatus Micrarchaeia archaeon]